MRLRRRIVLLATVLATAAWSGAPDEALVDAARAGDLEEVRALLAQGVDASTAKGDGMTALHWAAERGHTVMAEELIAAGAAVATGTRVGGYTPLHLAARGGHAEVVRALLDAGTEVDVVTTSSRVTALHLAAAALGGADAVRVLLERGADPTIRANDGWTAGEAARMAGHMDIANTLERRI